MACWKLHVTRNCGQLVEGKSGLPRTDIAAKGNHSVLQPQVLDSASNHMGLKKVAPSPVKTPNENTAPATTLMVALQRI